MSAGNSRLLYKPPRVPPQEALQILTTARLKPPPHLPVSADQLKRSCTSHAMSATKCLVSLMVVLVAAVCVAHAQERIKMCGRELIRLAVSSCGNSRLRRSILDLDVDQHQYTAHWDQDASMAEPRTAETDGESDLFSSAPHWFPRSSRITRAAGKISDICCEKGCSMKELIQFC